MNLRIGNFLKNEYYWFVSGLLLLIFFVSEGHSFSQVFYFISFLLPIVIGSSYYVNTILIPEYFLRKKYGSFILRSIYTLIISLYLQYLIIYLALFFFTSFQLGNPSILTIDIPILSLILYILVLIKVIIEILQKLTQKETIIKSLEIGKESALASLQDKLVVRYNRENYNISISSIYYIESLSDYISIVSQKEKIITKERISKILERLPAHFKRTHRSFIINSNQITSFNKAYITIGEHQIPISRTYKSEILNFLNEGED